MIKHNLCLVSLFVVNTTNAFALYTNNIQNGCDSNKKFVAVFQRKTIQCNSGWFLPANSVLCAQCDSNQICPGGTYEFNPHIYQGMTYSINIKNDLIKACAANSPIKLYATFKTAERYCTTGTYLPKNSYQCTPCKKDYYCPYNQRYTFNTTSDQGIINCTTTNPFAPKGSSACYPHKLHVGNDIVYLRSTKKTSPSLHVKLGNKIFYGNTTKTRTKMSADSEHFLHIKYNNTDYYVCDDSTYPE